jgi:hypothetical protein
MVLNPQNLTTTQEVPAGPLAGAELVRIVQNGLNAKSTLASLGSFSTGLGTVGAGNTGFVAATRTAAAAATIPATVQFVSTRGFAAVGDGGDGLYSKVGGTTPGGFQSADGAWWQLDVSNGANVRAFGADPTGNIDATVVFETAIAAAVANGDGVPVIARGTFLLTPPSDAFFGRATGPVIIRASGTWNLTATYIQGNFVHVIGEGGFDGQQFAVGPHYLTVNGPGGGLDAWRTESQFHHYMANVQIINPGSGGIGLHLKGADSATHQTQGALSKFENVQVQQFGADPAIQIDNWFWVWMSRCRVNTSGSNQKAMYITNDPSAGSAKSGLIYINDFIYSGGGIYIDAINADQTTGIQFRDLTHEDSVAPSFTLDGSAGGIVEAIGIHNFTAADAVSGGSGLHIKGYVVGVTLTGANDLKNDITVESGGVLTGLSMDNSTAGSPDFRFVRHLLA